MIKVQNFILIGDELLPFDSFEGPVPDPLYIEGAIHLEINGTVIMSLESWDLVDQLWAYIAQGLEALTTEMSWNTTFPDQPTELTFKTDARRQHVYVEVFLPKRQFAYIDPSGRRHDPEPTRRINASAEYSEFMQAMCEAGQQFFRRMIGLVPQKTTNYEKQLARLEAAMTDPANSEMGWMRV